MCSVSGARRILADYCVLMLEEVDLYQLVSFENILVDFSTCNGLLSRHPNSVFKSLKMSVLTLFLLAKKFHPSGCSENSYQCHGN